MLCYNCMRDKGNSVICPFCGVSQLPPPSNHHLIPGAVLANRYIVGRALGEGGFGITYIGYDRTLDTPVAVKEYFPYGCSYRVNTVSNTVTVSGSDNLAFFEQGKKKFLKEAKTIARFRDEPGIVNVMDFVEENNTVYIIMEYLDGIDLRRCLRKYGLMTVDQALDLLLPVIRSLEKIHTAGVIHRDISPDNLMFLKKGGVKLMDFGAARDFSAAKRTMSVVLKKGYAPEEQYSSDGKQGPWTDVYGICATIYRCITGRTPDEALNRVFEDKLVPPSALGVPISPAVENVLMYGLAVHARDRCRDMHELARRFEAARRAGAKTYQSPDKPPVDLARRRRRKRAVIAVASVAAALAVIITALAVIKPFFRGSDDDSTRQAEEAVGIAAYKLPETGSAAENFQAAYDYLARNVDLSDYTFNNIPDDADLTELELSDDQKYCYSEDKTVFRTELANTTFPRYHIETSITIAGQTYTIMESTLKEFLDEGWSYEKGSSPESNADAGQYVTLIKDDAELTAVLGKTGWNPKLAVVQNLLLGYDAFEDFSYGDVTPDDDLPAVIRKLGDPTSFQISGEEDHGYIYLNYQSTSYNSFVIFLFRYDPNSESFKMNGLYLSE